MTLGKFRSHSESKHSQLTSAQADCLDIESAEWILSWINSEHTNVHFLLCFLSSCPSWWFMGSSRGVANVSLPMKWYVCVKSWEPADNWNSGIIQSGKCKFWNRLTRPKNWSMQFRRLSSGSNCESSYTYHGISPIYLPFDGANGSCKYCQTIHLTDDDAGTSSELYPLLA